MVLVDPLGEEGALPIGGVLQRIYCRQWRIKNLSAHGLPVGVAGCGRIIRGEIMQVLERRFGRCEQVCDSLHGRVLVCPSDGVVEGRLELPDGGERIGIVEDPERNKDSLRRTDHTDQTRDTCDRGPRKFSAAASVSASWVYLLKKSVTSPHSFLNLSRGRRLVAGDAVGGEQRAPGGRSRDPTHLQRGVRKHLRIQQALRH